MGVLRRSSVRLFAGNRLRVGGRSVGFIASNPYFSAGSSCNTDFIYAWPGADISFIDPRVGVNVVHGKQIAQADDPDAERERLLAESTDFDTTPWGAAGHFHLDDVIDPREARSVAIRSLDYACGERFPRPVSERPLLSWPLRL